MRLVIAVVCSLGILIYQKYALIPETHAKGLGVEYLEAVFSGISSTSDMAFNSTYLHIRGFTEGQ